MQTYDSIVVGNGLAGAALSYELAKVGQSVLLMDDGNPHSGTRYSYGGIGYWAGTDDLTETLLNEGLARHQELSDELGGDTQLRTLNLLLTVDKGADVEAIKQSYQTFRTPPQFVPTQTACDIEPQLNGDRIEGAFVTQHAHVDPMSVVRAYNQAFRRLGGHHNLSKVTGLARVGDRITGVLTAAQAYPAGRVIIAAGAYSLQLLQAIDVQVPLFFTHAEIVETEPLAVEVRSLLMPAANARLDLESQSAQADWQVTNQSAEQQTGRQIFSHVLEAGVIQFKDRTARIGQISRFHTAYTPPADALKSEREIRAAIEPLVPALKNVPGQWRHCLVTYTQDGLPLIGPVPTLSGLHLFSGFTGPFSLVPPTAQRYAQHLTRSPDKWIRQMLVQRFAS